MRTGSVVNTNVCLPAAQKSGNALTKMQQRDIRGKPSTPFFAVESLYLTAGVVCF